MNSLEKTSLQVKQFHHFRSFLQKYAEEHKQSHPSWSYGAWAKALRLRTTSSITKILNGQRDPGPEMVEELIRYFQFNPSDAHYFRDLVQLHKSRHDPKMTVLLMEKMERLHPDGAVKVLDKEVFSTISRWYHIPLRELLRIWKHPSGPEQLAQKFRFGVLARDIQQALFNLKKTGLVEQKEDGSYELLQNTISSTSGISDEAIKRYHEQMIDHARSSIRTIPIEERHIAAGTICVRASQLPEMREMIEEFRKRLRQTFAVESGDTVYQIQIQAFPLTKTLTPADFAHSQKENLNVTLPH